MSTAREEAERRWPEIDTSTGGSILQSYAERYAMRRSGFVEGAEWQASREPTEAQIEAVAKALYTSKAWNRLDERTPCWEDQSTEVRGNYMMNAESLLKVARKAVTA
ncbi:MAG: hypothetical protein LKI88_00745 [Bifidobacterium sp.]|jgi:hypothetical protein|nr:hypothetical protein [Bifidobacterium sp.]MCI1864458.1 hypothetical protein [Bifidobacterium sp.]